jgi:hypothetical protein
MQKNQQNGLLEKHVHSNLLPIQQTNRETASQRTKPPIRVGTATPYVKRQYTTRPTAERYT